MFDLQTINYNNEVLARRAAGKSKAGDRVYEYCKDAEQMVWKECEYDGQDPASWLCLHEDKDNGSESA